ncbi:sodium/hydrogen exchanger family domain-containing protein [Ditylenchus destructor]|nr:sodium/hydrogen exchanger family domain-containing protein [Ditylenchus destructor]
MNSWLRSTFGLVILLNFIGCSTLAEIDPSIQIEKKAHVIQRVQTPTTENKTESSRFQIVSFAWEHVEAPYTISAWLLLASIAKILFHVHKKFGESVPDSALLIVVGLILGWALKQFNVDDAMFSMKSEVFFLYLLPPIIFDAGYFMPNRQLFENFDSVLLFAIVGTVWNTISIGGTLLFLSQYNIFSFNFSTFEILLFAALISAVDPVAVIAVFEEIHVNEFLFVNVFGEALFNDGVTVVLYQMFRKFIDIGSENLITIDYIAGAMSFFVIAIGGILIGLAFAVIVCIITKFTDRVKILAPVFIFVVPYMSYLTAEMFGLSSILAIVACGIAMKQYVKGNITHDASSSVKYFVKMLAQCSETVIFMFLGLSTISSNHHWDAAFLCITVAICLIYRCIGVVVQCAVLNRIRNKKFSAIDQFVLSYGGLRGAIAFGLVVSMPETIACKNMFVTTCIAVIYFTVFLQGITIRPLLSLLKVEKQDLEKQDTMIENVYNRYCDYTMAGIEDIAGQKGRNSIRDAFERFNAKVLKPLLMKDQKRNVFDASAIVRAYTKITLHEAMKISTGLHKIGSTKSSKVAPADNYLNSEYTNTDHTVPKYESRKSSFFLGQTNDDRRPSLRVELDDHMASQANTEALYDMFSRLLDRKMTELQKMGTTTGLPIKTNAVLGEKREDDIKDNYMEELKPESVARQSQVGRNSLNNFRLQHLTNGRAMTTSEQLSATRPQESRRRMSQPSSELKRIKGIPGTKNDDNPA